MLTRLFNNLSLQSLISALAVSFILLLAAVFLKDYAASELIFPALRIGIPAHLYEVALLFFLPFGALWFNSMLTGRGILKNHYFLVPLLVLQLYVFSLNQNRPEVLLALPLFLLVFRRLLQLTGAVNPLYVAFDAGLLCGLITVFYPEGAIVLLFVWTALLLFGQMSFRTLLLPLIGTFAVYFLFYAAFYFLSDYDFVQYMTGRFSDISFGFKGILLARFSLYLPIGLVLIPALGEYMKAVNFAKIKKRQVLNLMVIILVATFFAGSFFKDREVIYGFLAFPLSVLQTNLLQYMKKWWLQDLVYLAVLLSFFLIVFHL